MLKLNFRNYKTMDPSIYYTNERTFYDPLTDSYVAFYKASIENIVNVDSKKLDERRRYLNMAGVYQFSYMATIFKEEQFPPLVFIDWHTGSMRHWSEMDPTK